MAQAMDLNSNHDEVATPTSNHVIRSTNANLQPSKT